MNDNNFICRKLVNDHNLRIVPIVEADEIIEFYFWCDDCIPGFSGRIFVAAFPTLIDAFNEAMIEIEKHAFTEFWNQGTVPNLSL